MPAIVRSYEWSTHHHGISQNGRKAQQNGLMARSPTEKNAKLAPFRLFTPLYSKADHPSTQQRDFSNERWYSTLQP